MARIIPTREEVFDALSEERDYQEERWSRPQHAHSITEYLVFMEHYINEAKKKVSTLDGEHEALPDLRKITALGVAAMEENGLVTRSQEKQ